MRQKTPIKITSSTILSLLSHVANRNIAVPYLLLGLACVISGCVSRRSESDNSPVRVFDKPGTRVGKVSDARPHTAKSLYVKKKTISIRSTNRPNTSGSLFNLDDERNYLFSARGPLTTGRFIDVKIASTRVGVGGSKSAEGSEKGKESSKSKSGEQDSVEDTLIKSLPELEPASEDAVVIKRFKMKIAHRYSNGDVMVVSQRRSLGSQDASEIALQGRIPYDRLISGRDITTDDLTDVSLLESQDGEVIERRSSGWEDDYTLRLSGFSEAKSKIASKLDEQRAQMKKIREQLRTRLVSAGKERKQMATERNKLLEAGQQSVGKIEKLNAIVKEKEALINEQKGLLGEKDKEIETLMKQGGEAGN